MTIGWIYSSEFVEKSNKGPLSKTLLGLCGTVVTGLTVNFLYDSFKNDERETANARMKQELAATVEEILQEQQDPEAQDTPPSIPKIPSDTDEPQPETEKTDSGSGDTPVMILSSSDDRSEPMDNPVAAASSEKHPSSPDPSPPNSSPTNEIDSFSVFDGKEFELCGYEDFTATMSENPDGTNEIHLKSKDRRIPDIPFQGFRTKLELETPTELWPGCTVIATYVNVSGIIRYAFTVEEPSKK